MTISRKVLLASLLLGLYLCGGALAQEQSVDLTDHKTQTTRGLPGYSSHSGGGASPNAVLIFKPEVELISAKFNGKGDLLLEVALINKSSVPLAVPISLDQAKVHKEGCGSRTEVNFSLRRKELAEQQGAESPLETVYGSNCDVNSFRTLSPGGRLVLRLSSRGPVIPMNWGHQVSPGHQVNAGDQVYIALQLYRIAESSFMINGQSTESVSNKVTVQGAQKP